MKERKKRERKEKHSFTQKINRITENDKKQKSNNAKRTLNILIKNKMTAPPPCFKLLE